MEDFNYPVKVYEQLAQQFMTEQAELVRKQKEVVSLRNLLLGKKKDLILRFVKNKVFCMNNKKYCVLYCGADIDEWGMYVSLEFGLLPECIDLRGLKLTKKEQWLLESYKRAFRMTPLGIPQVAALEAMDAADGLRMLKNRLKLSIFGNWHIELDELTDPHFFDSTGLEIREEGYMKTLEELVIKN